MTRRRSRVVDGLRIRRRSDALRIRVLGWKPLRILTTRGWVGLKVAAITLSALVLNVSLVQATPDPFFDALVRLDADSTIQNGNAWSDSPDANFTGTFAWTQSYVFRAFMSAYRVTHDLHWLRQLVYQADNVFNRRDDTLGLPDYSDSIRAVWQTRARKYCSADYWCCSPEYPESCRTMHPYAYLGHSGQITDGIADFAQLVIGTPELWDSLSYAGETLADAAYRFSQKLLQTNSAHAMEWDPALGAYRSRGNSCVPASGEACDDNSANEPPPYNAHTALAETQLHLYRATQDPALLATASQIAEYFRDPANLRLQPGADPPRYIWGYGQAPYHSMTREDISHASMNLRFALSCHDYGVLFDAEDLALFAATFLHNVYGGPAPYAHGYWSGSTFVRVPVYIRDNNDGTLDSEHPYANTYYAGAWAPLASVDRAVYHILADLYIENATTIPPEITSGRYWDIYALLAEYEAHLRMFAVNRQAGDASDFAAVCSGDFVADDVAEIVTLRNYDSGIALRRLSGSTIETIRTRSEPGSTWLCAAAADVDGDGLDELLVAREPDSRLLLYRPRDTGIDLLGTFDFGQNMQWSGIAGGDFDGDGSEEFAACRNSDAHILIYGYDGSALHIRTEYGGASGHSDWAALTAGDIDADGKDEIIGARNLDGGVIAYGVSEGQITILMSIGYPQLDWRSCSAADIDGDGRAECLAISTTDGWVRALDVNDGDLVEAYSESMPGDWSLSCAALGCFRGHDERADLLIVRNSNADLIVYAVDPPSRVPGIPSAVNDHHLPMGQRGQTIRMHVAPNPTSLGCRVMLESPVGSMCRVAIVDVTGREVWHSDVSLAAARVTTLEWDGTADSGRLSANGIYWVAASAGACSVGSKLVIVR